MPLLSVATTYDADPDERAALGEAVAARFADHMRTGTDHVAVAVDVRAPGDLWIGRAVDGDLFFLDADVRAGRDQAAKRSFALAVMEYARDEWGIPEANTKVVFTEHDGPDMMGYDRVGDAWTPDEDT